MCGYKDDFRSIEYVMWLAVECSTMQNAEKKRIAIHIQTHAHTQTHTNMKTFK